VRILLDTNIIIPLEDSSTVLAESLGKLVKLANENGHQLLIHPASIEDLNRDKDKERRRISVSRIQKYTALIAPPTFTDSDREKLKLSETSDNDRIDNLIIFALYKNAVNLLITEDREIHKKAAKLGIDERVHYIQQAASSLEILHSKFHVDLPNIDELSLHQINLSSSFFDSLRKSYPGFDNWYNDASMSGRRAWVHLDGAGHLGAIAIYKVESSPIVTDNNTGLPGNVLKLCTFKVGESLRGRKIGELLLKASFRYATVNQLTSIYLTMRPDEQPYLADLCEDFGFKEFGEHKDDFVYVKDHPVSPPNLRIDPFLFHQRYYPHFNSDENVSKYIVPIRPEFHTILFPDIQQQGSLFISGTAGNAIKQAYLCHAKLAGIRPGDLLLFYRSKDQKAITSIGVVEQIADTQDKDKILELVSKRTVYSYEDILSMAEKQTKVLLFRLAKHLDETKEYQWLLDNNIVRGQIQTIRRISDDSFRKIIS